MKFFIVFIFTSINLSVHCQNKIIICGKIKSQKKWNINIYEPINGYYNLASFNMPGDTVKIIDSDSIHKIIKLDSPSFVEIYFKNDKDQFLTLTNLLLFPGDSIHLNIDLTYDSPNAIQYHGSNAKGQTLFNEINYDPYEKYIPVFDALDKLPSSRKSFISEVDDAALLVNNRFDSLRKMNLISIKFQEYMNICFKSLFYNEVVNRLLRKSKKSQQISKQEKYLIISTLFKKLKATDPKIKGIYLSLFYINNYFNFLACKKLKLNNIADLTKDARAYTLNYNKYLVNNDFVPFTYIENKIKREDLWALEILGLYNWMPGKYGKAIIAQFDSIFPNSKWSTYLVSQFKSKHSEKNIGYKLQTPIKYIDTLKQINTIPDLLAELPLDKAIFIDIWASWCSPCIANFGFNQIIDSFLLSNNIEKLYISLDNQDDISKWKNAINRYMLGGYHILANENLKIQIKKDIYHSLENSGMPIPKYILIDKNGKIALEDTYSPENFEILSKQILEALSSK